MRIFERRWPPWLAPIFVATIAILAHSGNLSNGITNWDDPAYIVTNPLIRDIGIGPAARLFTRFYNNDYYPLNQLSYMVDYAIWELDPKGYHLTNMLLHALSAALALLVARRLIGGEVAPLVAALTFAVHPVNVESVAWLSERKNVLSMAFLLLSFLLYLERGRRPQRDRALLIGSLVAFVAAALSKTIVAPYPALLVAYDLVYRRESWLRRLPEKVPFFVVSGVVSVLTVMSQGEAGAIPPYIGRSFVNNIWTMMGVYLTYLRMLVLPVGLNARYASTYITSFADPRVVVGISVVIAVFVIAWLSRDRWKWLTFSVLWFFLILLPVSHIIPTSVLYADRYLYFPTLAFGWVLGCLAHVAVSRWSRPAVAVVVAVMILWTVGTVRRTADWRDAVTLWEASVATDPDNFFAYAILGDAYVRADRLDDAIQAKEHGMKLNPEWRHSHIELTNTGLLYYAKGDLERAELLFNEAREAEPYYGQAYKGLGMVASKRGRCGSGRYYYLVAVANGVDDERVRRGLKSCLEKLGQGERYSRFEAEPLSLVREETAMHRAEARQEAEGGDFRSARARLVMASRLAPGSKEIEREIAALGK